MTDTLELSFTSDLSAEIELSRVCYKQAGDAPERVCVRGKSGGVYRSAGSFQWTSAVQALCAVCLSAVLHDKRPAEWKPYLAGKRGSLASSLDYALSKMPNWLEEIFGSNSLGAPRARRIFLTTNPNRKRPGPVIISLNPVLLPAEQIVIFLDGKPVVDASDLGEIANHLLQRDLLVTESAELLKAA
jgi:hypothetical protein